MKASQLRNIIKEEISKALSENATQVDMKGKKCTSCKKGKYEETSQMDDLEGVLHCTKCGTEIERYTIKENVEMDKMNQTLNDKVGVKSANPSVKNTMKKKEFKVEFQQYINDDYDVDFITVKAEDEADALVKAKEQLKQSGKRNIRYDKLKVIK
jgi:uncharacterized protein (DUF305 family)